MIGVNTYYGDESEKLIKNNKIRLLQIFVDSDDNDKNIIDNYDADYIVHASYSINLSRNWTEYSVWINTLISEINIAQVIKSKYIVVHLGKKLDLDNNVAYNNMYTSLLYVHNKTKKCKDVKICIETSSGQGTEMCYELKELAYFYGKIKNHPDKTFSNRVKICIDTCHIYASGIDINSKDKFKAFISKFDDMIGLNNLGLVHLNNSKEECGSKKDRHANFHNGKINMDVMMHIGKHFYDMNVPIIIETPHNDIINDYLKIEKYTK